mmetsp:Transcript_7586/g.21561  ORF Transcript_7586/g.21561 Transcript_7586/m.21561 type:complete len:323 (-) Transcript_7586:156-1124(-)
MSEREVGNVNLGLVEVEAIRQAHLDRCLAGDKIAVGQHGALRVSSGARRVADGGKVVSSGGAVRMGVGTAIRLELAEGVERNARGLGCGAELLVDLVNADQSAQRRALRRGLKKFANGRCTTKRNLEARLSSNVLHNVRAERIVQRHRHESMGVTSLLDNGPLGTVDHHNTNKGALLQTKTTGQSRSDAGHPLVDVVISLPHERTRLTVFPDGAVAETRPAGEQAHTALKVVVQRFHTCKWNRRERLRVERCLIVPVDTSLPGALRGCHRCLLPRHLAQHRALSRRGVRSLLLLPQKVQSQHSRQARRICRSQQRVERLVDL